MDKSAGTFVRDLGKRLFDVVVSATLLCLLLPLVILTTFVAWVSFRAKPFFFHHRVGRDGKLIRFVKLRTLPASTPKYADKYAIQGATVPAPMRFIRRSKLDELPQLALVLTGSMSLVGPRPEMLSLHEKFSPEFADLRTGVRPGCTGLWQIGAHSDRLIWEAPQYDEFYLRHRTMRLDIWLLCQTVRVAIGGRKIELEDVPSWTLPRGLRPTMAPWPTQRIPELIERMHSPAAGS